jgi:virulence-associated protein VapD
MRYLTYSLIVIGLFAMASCTQKKNEYADIQKMFDTLGLKIQQGYIDTAYLNKTIAEVKQYADEHPKDSLAAKLLFQSAQQLESHKMADQAVQILEKIQKDFSESAYAAKALLTEGFIYNNILHNIDQAKVKYNEYLEKYKNLDTNLSRDVELELQHLGKSAEELVKEFEARIKESEASNTK